MSPPDVPASVWVWAAFDPVLIAVAVYLGWKADQAGKIFIAAIAALGLSVLIDWAITVVGLPSLAPVSRSGPMLLPVRAVAAVLWASAAFGARRATGR